MFLVFPGIRKHLKTDHKEKPKSKLNFGEWNWNRQVDNVLNATKTSVH